jgi:hypothetical protein
MTELERGDRFCEQDGSVYVHLRIVNKDRAPS